MLVSTMNDVPGRTVQQVIGEVTGLTVRSRNVGAQIGAGFKSIVGGELKGLTKQLQQSRDEAVARMVEEATAQGANAILAMRYDSDEVGNGYQEVLAGQDVPWLEVRGDRASRLARAIDAVGPLLATPRAVAAPMTQAGTDAY